MKKIVSIVLSVIMVMSLLPLNVLTASASDFGGGDGTPENPYQIFNSEQLSAINNDLTANYIICNNITTNSDWQPINGVFKGYLDGQGYSISNLKLNTNKHKKLGLFEECSGVIKNLNFEKSQLKTSRNTDDNIDVFYGIVTAIQSGGSIENCCISAELTIGTTSDFRDSVYVGGFTGKSNDKSTIINCRFEGTINVVSPSTNITVYGGGISGENDGSIINCSTNVEAKCEVTLNNLNYSSDLFFGGIVGYGRNIKNSETKLNIISSVCGSANIGGISGVGYSGNITDCRAEGTIVCDANSSCKIGGITGLLNPGIYGGGTLYNSQARFEIISDKNNNTGRTYRKLIGGLVGETSYASVQNSVFIGNISVYSHSDNATSGPIYSGGLVGQSSGSVINDCYSISNCYGESTTGSSSSSRHFGEINLGGLIGSFYNNNNLLKNCYYSGTLDGYADNQENIGAVFGEHFLGEYNIENCYYNSDLCGLSNQIQFGKDSSLLQNEDTFTNWDFNNVWIIKANFNSGYPMLRNISIESQNNMYSGKFSYVVDNDQNAIITKIVNNDDTETISIPTEIDGYKVVAIDEYCIPDSANIKRITIPSTITHIDENAFNGYDGIEIIYYFSTKDDWIEITDGIHYISDDTELVYVMDDVENTEISDYNKPEKEKDNNVNFTNAIRDWEKEKNDWIDTLVKVVNNIKDDVSVNNEEAITNNYEKNKERIDAMIADEGWYQSGSDGARDAAFRAVYDMIADWGEESISLDKIDPSSDVVDFSTRIVKNVINGMKNQTIEKDYGDYTVLITVSGISTGLFENPAFTGSVTVKHKNGKTFGPALINSTVDDTKQVMSDYMLQLKELEENTVEMAMETYVSDLISLTDSKLPLDAIKEKLDSASEIINDTLEEKGLGNLNNFIGGVIDVIKSTKEVIELQNGGDTDALVRAVADLDSKLDFLSGESTTATSATLDWAYKNLKQKTKYLKEVTEAYIDGKEIPEYETTLDKIVGWFDKHIFQCPVDVYVYSGNDELIGCVSDEQIFGDTEEIYVEKNGDTKTVYVAEGANVHFKLVGTDIGNLDYVAETYSENKVVGRTNFYGIELYDGKEITAETTDEKAQNNCNEIILQSDGETINTTEYLKATDNASVLIESNVVGNGTIVGTGWYARGDSVTLVASPDDGYVFKGWYNGDTPITFNANYTFCAKDFFEVTANFEKYEENYSVSIPVSEGFKNIYDISADSDEDNVYVYVKELSEEADVSKLNLYLAEYETSGKLSALKIADIKVDSNGTMIFTIPYPQLEDFKIMLWTNNITPVIDVLN